MLASIKHTFHTIWWSNGNYKFQNIIPSIDATKMKIKLIVYMSGKITPSSFIVNFVPLNLLLLFQVEVDLHATLIDQWIMPLILHKMVYFVTLTPLFREILLTILDIKVCCLLSSVQLFYLLSLLLIKVWITFGLKLTQL